MSSLLLKLRIKFMLMTTGIVAILVTIIAAAYCATVYTSITDGIDKALDHAINASTGQIPPPKPDQGQPPPDDRFGQPSSDPSSDSSGQSEQPDLSGQSRQSELPGPSEQPDLSGPSDSPDQTGQSDPGDESGEDAGTGGNEEAPSESSVELGKDQRIDLFRGQNALVYSVVVDSIGTVLRNDSPAIELDESVLDESISYLLSQPDFAMEDGEETSGKISSTNLFYKAKVQGDDVYVALTDSSSPDSRLQDAVIGSCGLAGLALLLTIAISFFLARLFLRPVEDAWSKQRRFIADASHELKTPLTVIMANTEIVRSAPQATVASQMKWLDGTMDESERMHGLIADLLLLARMDDERATAAPSSAERVDFSEAVESAVVSFEAIAFERELELEASVDTGIFVKGLRPRLARLPDILIDNACKYAEKGGIVAISLKRIGGKAVLRVFNTGTEIADGDLGHLFDRFYRADESRSDDIPGYGLGLSIARNIVEESEGSIEVENVLGKGVAFVVSLPISMEQA